MTYNLLAEISVDIKIVCWFSRSLKNYLSNLTGKKILPGSLSNRQFCYNNMNIFYLSLTCLSKHVKYKYFLGRMKFNPMNFGLMLMWSSQESSWMQRRFSSTKICLHSLLSFQSHNHWYFNSVIIEFCNFLQCKKKLTGMLSFNVKDYLYFTFSSKLPSKVPWA